MLELFGRLGSVITLPEGLLGPATAIMGVGPAYQALLAEAQVDAGGAPRADTRAGRAAGRRDDGR